eukprot:3379419-Rhodomonas_salina.2
MLLRSCAGAVGRHPDIFGGARCACCRDRVATRESEPAGKARGREQAGGQRAYERSRRRCHAALLLVPSRRCSILVSYTGSGHANSVRRSSCSRFCPSGAFRASERQHCSPASSPGFQAHQCQTGTFRRDASGGVRSLGDFDWQAYLPPASAGPKDLTLSSSTYM